MKRQFYLLIGLVLPLTAVLVLLSWLPRGPALLRQPVAMAQSNIITVTTGLDNTAVDPVDPTDCASGGPGCTLREAIARANSFPGGDALIVFDAAYTITLAYRTPPGDGSVLPFDTLAQPDVGIDGDLNDDCAPDVVVNGENITDAGTTASGLRIAGDGGVIQGLVIQNFKDYGVQIANGDNLTLTCNYIGADLSGRNPAPNRLGIYINRAAHDNHIVGNVIAGNSQNGVQISTLSDFPTTTIPFSNTIAGNWIGTNPWGDQLGNASKGVLIQHNAYNNLVYDNQIRYNGCYGVHLRGRHDGDDIYDPGDDAFYPPRGNRIISNTISHNNVDACPGSGAATARAGVVNEDTHLAVSNTLPSLAAADYDNLIADNLISDNGGFDGVEPLGFGIFNLGASPLITGNVVQNNTHHGIFNQVDFNYTYSPLDAADDILSIPIIQGNTVQDNGGHGIRSLDTAPVAPYQLHISNTVQNNDQGAGGEEVDVSQVWYGLIEVLRGDVLTHTVPITQYAAPRITNLTDPAYRYELYQSIQVGPPYDSALWADNNDDDYFDVGTWVVVPQFVVTAATHLRDYSPQSVVVEFVGAVSFTETFSFDGLTATHPVTGDQLAPAYVETGPYGRYQVAQVYILDSDGDTIPDDVECPEGPPCEDSDDDGLPDWQDDDSDDDGIPDADECPGGLPCQDSDGDGIPDWQDDDDDGDGIPTPDECPEGPPCDDSDDDGIPDYLDPDDDGDGIPTDDECPAGPPCPDSDDDGIPDYLDPDDDDDGIPTQDEYNDPADPDDDFCTNTEQDSDGDGIPDCQDNDADGDGIPNYLDPDSDGDGMPDEVECPAGPPCPDSDGDGVPDWLDPHYYIYLPLVLRNH